MLVCRLDDEVRIERVETRAELDKWRPGFIAAYKKIFREAPYLEDIDDDQAAFAWDFLTAARDHITLIAATDDDTVVGFGIAVPLAHTKRVRAALAGLVPLKPTYYLAELGVMPEYRGRGLGRKLIAERMKQMDRERYSHVVLRVATTRNISADLYAAMGFQDMGVYMDVRNPRVDGTVTTDRRVFLSRVLSQVDVD